VADGPFQATGIKIGEVTHSSAIVWARLTLRPEPNPAVGAMPVVVYDEDARAGRRQRKVREVRFPEGYTVASIDDAVPGVAGQVRLHYGAKAQGTAFTHQTDWVSVDPEADYTHQFQLRRLLPNTLYQLEVHCRPDPQSPEGPPLEGSFTTAPAPFERTRVVFTVSTGQRFPHKDRPDGFNIYPSMLSFRPSFFVHTGDIVYYDELGKSPELAHYHWQRTYGLPTNVDFHSQVASYFIKDDHDTWMNDCWPTMQSGFMDRLTFAQGQQIFRQQVPMGDTTFRTVRWGKDLQIWLVEGRDFRSPNTDPDGPDKTIWGSPQKAWFKQTVLESDATFRVLISPTPIVGPDRTNKKDNHANRSFQTEGDELRRFMAEQKNMFVICGDRHWQYFSVDPVTQLREFSCGPASDAHAGGWRQQDQRPEYHRYLNVVGGYLSAAIGPTDPPTITIRFHRTTGGVLFEHAIAADR
jgi:alkaline phosphatase D